MIHGLPNATAILIVAVDHMARELGGPVATLHILDRAIEAAEDCDHDGGAFLPPRLPYRYRWMRPDPETLHAETLVYAHRLAGRS